MAGSCRHPGGFAQMSNVFCDVFRDGNGTWAFGADGGALPDIDRFDVRGFAGLSGGQAVQALAKSQARNRDERRRSRQPRRAKTFVTMKTCDSL